MIHWGVFGESGSGKSVSTSQYIAPSWLWPARFGLKRPARHVLVCDPQMKAMWRGKCTWITPDVDAWVAAMKASRECVCIWDEAGNSMEADPAMALRHSWVAMQSRNLGHLVYFLCQRAGQLPIGVGNQCAQAYVFFQRSPYDRRILAQAYGEEMHQAGQLTVGECLIGQPMKKPVKTRFFSVR